MLYRTGGELLLLPPPLLLLHLRSSSSLSLSLTLSLAAALSVRRVCRVPSPPLVPSALTTSAPLLFSLCPGAVPAVPVVPYTCMQWEWDEAKFQLKTPLRELSESISLRISSLDEELKIKVTEMNVLKGSLQTIERKTQGNLMVRGLADLIGEEDTMVSEYMMTVFVVVQKGMMKEFEGAFERMATYVVPRSAKLISEDTE